MPKAPNHFFILFFLLAGKIFSQPVYTENVPKRFTLDDTVATAGTMCVLEHVHFMFYTTKLDSSFYGELDKLAAFLKRDTSIYIEIRSHIAPTSVQMCSAPTGSRSRNIANYLVSKGIPDSHMRAIGYGDSRPYIVDKDDGIFKRGDVLNEKYVNKLVKKEDQQKAYRLNNRVEIWIMKAGKK